MRVHPVQLQSPSSSRSRGWRADVGHWWEDPFHHHPSLSIPLPAVFQQVREEPLERDLLKSILFLPRILTYPPQIQQCRSRGCWGYSRRQSRVLKAHLPVGRQVYFLCPLLGMNPGRQVYSTSSPTSYTFLSTLMVANSTSGGLGQTGGKELTRNWVENWSCFCFSTWNRGFSIVMSYSVSLQLTAAISIRQKKMCSSSSPPQQLYQWSQLDFVSLFKLKFTFPSK